MCPPTQVPDHSHRHPAVTPGGYGTIDWVSEQALSNRSRTLSRVGDVQIAWQPFELRPEPTPTLRPEGDYLQSTWQRVVYPMAERMGDPIVLPRVSPQPYSRLAFEGFAFAVERGVGQRYTERMFRAFFVEQRDIGQPEVLADVAAELGLEAGDFRAALDSGRYAEAHQQALRRARQLQITVAPTFLIDGQRLEGMPSTEGLNQLLNGAALVGSGSRLPTKLR